MRTRKSERRVINWNTKCVDTINKIALGEAFAMNDFRNLDREEQVKELNDMSDIMLAPKDSVVWKRAAKSIGKNFKDKVSEVYNYGRTIMRIQKDIGV